MHATLESLEADVLQLTLIERSHLLERLIASLDIDPEVEAAWDTEADRRESSQAAGHARDIPAQEVITRLRARLAR